MRLDRVNAIEQYIIEQGTVPIDALVQKFNTSVNTIRRDLNELVKRGNIKKVHGGVTVTQTNTLIPVPVRSKMNYEKKEYMGRLAASLVNDGDTIFIDSGTTALHIIKHLINKHNITIVTHSLLALAEASQMKELSLISLGGIYNWGTGSFVGVSTLDILRKMTINISFIGAKGVSIENGITDTTFFQIEIKREIMSRSKKNVLMVDSSKFENDALLIVSKLEEFDVVVTDERPPHKYVTFFKNNKVKLLFGQDET